MIFLALLFSATTLAVPQSPAISVPETVVTISIFDLIEQQKKAARNEPVYRLPADYGNRIAKLILENKNLLTDCLPSRKEFAKTVKFELAVAPNGIGKSKVIVPLDHRLETCLSEALNSLDYPTHELKRAVTVHLPLLLEKKVL